MNDEFSEFLIAGIIGIFGWFFGGIDGYIKVLIACTAVDYVTGVLRGGKEGKLSSQIAFWGIARKIVMFFFVGIAHIIDDMLGGNAGFRTVIILFYIGNEGISIIENADKLGVPIPKFLRGKFLKFMENNTEDNTQQEKTA